MTTEDWRDVPGYEGLYQINQRGEVRSLRKLGQWKTICPIKQGISTSGKPYVQLCKNSKRSTVYVETLLRQVGW